MSYLGESMIPGKILSGMKKRAEEADRFLEENANRTRRADSAGRAVSRAAGLCKTLEELSEL